MWLVYANQCVNEKLPPGSCFLWKKVKPATLLKVLPVLEAPPGIEPGMKVLQTSALPLGYGAEKNGAGYEARTRYLHLGKVALYQMS